MKNFPTGGAGWVRKKSKNVQVSEGGASQNLGTVPKSYLVINYDGFPKTHLSLNNKQGLR